MLAVRHPRDNPEIEIFWASELHSHLAGRILIELNDTRVSKDFENTIFLCNWVTERSYLGACMHDTSSVV